MSKVISKDGTVIAYERSGPDRLGVLYRFLYDHEMKTTLDIDDELLVKAKALSARERKSLTALIEEGLRLRLRLRAQKRSRSRPPLPIYRGQGGLAKGVDPTSNRSMLDAAGDDA